MLKNRTKIVAGILALVPASLAMADTLTGSFNYDLAQNVSVTSPVETGGELTVRFNWTRLDSPGAGIDSSIGSQFNTYCVDIAQGVVPGATNVFNVMTAQQYGLTQSQTTLLTDLWGTYIGSVNSATSASAFQLDVWELMYDTNHNISTGTFQAQTDQATTTLAQSWLDSITSPTFQYSGPALDARLLQSDSVQDQITFVPGTNVPTPGTGVLAAAAAGVAFGRRRRR